MVSIRKRRSDDHREAVLGRTTFAPALLALVVLLASPSNADHGTSAHRLGAPATSFAQAADGMRLVDRVGGGAFAVVARALPEGRREVFHGSGGRVGYALEPTPAETRPIAHLSPPLAGLVRGLALRDDHLLVTTGPGGLQVLDVSSPDRMRLVSTLWLQAVADAIVVRDDRAYVSLGPQGLAVVNIEDLDSPELVARLPAPAGEPIRELALDGDRLLTASGVAGLRVLSLERRDAPEELGALDRIDGFPLDVEALHVPTRDAADGMRADEVWISDGPRLHRIELSDAGSPRATQSVDVQGAQVRALVSVDDEVLAIAIDDLDASIQIHRLQAEDPEGSRHRIRIGGHHWAPGIFALPFPAPALAHAGRHVYLAAGSEGLLGIDLETESTRSFLRSDHPGWPQASTSVEPLGNAADVGVEGLTVIGSADGHIEAREIPALSPARESPSAYLGADPRDLLERRGRIIGAGGADGIFALGYSLGASRPMLALDDRPAWLEGSVQAAQRLALSADETMLYVADQIDGLRIVSLIDPDRPEDIGGIDLGFDYPEDVFVAGERLFVAQGSAVSVFDIREPARPRLLSSVQTPGFARGIAAWFDAQDESPEAAHSLVYVADDQAGLTVIDARNPNALRVVASVDTPGSAQAVAVDGSGQRVYVADGEGGLQAFEVPTRAPQDARWTRSYLLAEEAVHVHWNEGLVQVSSRGYGFFVLEDPDAPRPPSPGPAAILLPLLQPEQR